MEASVNSQFRAKDIAYIAVFAALMAVCSWIGIPTPWNISFTLQTMGVFMAVGILGGKRGTIAVLVYILLGAIGLPVFASFQGGLGALLGSTGGYIIGFLFSALVMWLIERLAGTKLPVLALSMAVGLIVCYAFGTVWFKQVYTSANGAVGLGTVLAWCVTPYIIPDLIKLALALLLTSRLRPHVK